MKNILFIICAFAFLSTSLISVAHAHVDNQNSNQQIELSIGIDSDIHNDGDSLCDMHCHSHIAPMDLTQGTLPRIESNAIAMRFEFTISPLPFELNRPPKI